MRAQNCQFFMELYCKSIMWNGRIPSADIYTYRWTFRANFSIRNFLFWMCIGWQWRVLNLKRGFMYQASVQCCNITSVREILVFFNQWVLPCSGFLLSFMLFSPPTGISMAPMRKVAREMGSWQRGNGEQDPYMTGPTLRIMGRRWYKTVNEHLLRHFSS